MIFFILSQVILTNNSLWEKNNIKQCIQHTYIRFTIPNQIIAIVAVSVQYRITLTSSNSTVVPAFARQRRSVQQLLRIVIITIGGVGIVVVGLLIVWPSIQRVRPASVVSPVGLRQILGQFLQVIPRHQSNLAVVVAGFIPKREKGKCFTGVLEGFLVCLPFRIRCRSV